MKTLTRQKKTDTKQDLQFELLRLRSFVISIAGRDEEGAYRPEFVEQILRASQETPTHTFTDSASFLAQIKNA